MRKVLSILLLLPVIGLASDSLGTLHAGIAVRKFTGFYWLNGVTAEWSPPALRSRQLSATATIVHSGLGSAAGSRAIPVLNAELSLYWDARKNKTLHPRLGLNAGYARANLGSEFASIPRQAGIFSLEAGLAATGFGKFKGSLTLAYNIFTGNGMKGAGIVHVK